MIKFSTLFLISIFSFIFSPYIFAAEISGTVFDQDGVPITYGSVYAYDSTDPCYTWQGSSASAEIDSTGNYSLPGLAEGNYYLQAFFPGDNWLKWWWSDQGSTLECSQAQIVTVVSGENVSGKTFQIDQGSAISGTVYDDVGTPITDGSVFAYTGNPCGNRTEISITRLDANGNYAFLKLAAGNYYLIAHPNGNIWSEWWAALESSQNCSEAQSLTVLAGESAVDKHFQLTPKPSTYTLTYTAGVNGSISGDSPQTVPYNESGTEVTAVPGNGFFFERWSDGRAHNPRIDSNVSRSIDVTATFLALPVNDAFKSAIEVTNVPLSVGATNVGATKETGEPDHGGNGTSLWWKWTASSADTVAIHLHHFVGAVGRPQHVSAVYTGNSVDSLTPVTVTGSGDEIILNPIVGTSYFIAVDSAYPDIFTFNITPYTPVQNNNFTDATTLIENSGAVNAHNIRTGSEAGESDHSNFGFGSSSSVWWQWTATTTDPVAINIIDANFEECAVVYTGTDVASLTAIAGVRFGYPNFIPVANTTYYIAVANDSESWFKTGAFKISISQHSLPQNDSFADALPITSAMIPGYNVGATLETNENWDYGIEGYYGGRSSVWYKWVATSEDKLSVEILKSNFNAALAVFTGNAVDNLTRVASDLTKLNFTPVKDEVYYFVVNGHDDTQGDFTIKLSGNGISRSFAWPLFLPAIIGNR